MTRVQLGTFAFFVLMINGVALAKEPTAEPDFNTQVSAVFQKYCIGCHDEVLKEGGLVLESYDQLLAGGRRGVAVVPGKSDQSRLVLVLEGKAKPAMPPEGNEAPTADEVALLKLWIDSGAKGPTGAPPDPTQLVTPKIDPLETPRTPISAAAWSPDGTLMALAGYARITIRSATDRTRVRELTDLRGNVNGVSFSKDSSLLVTASGEPGLFGEARIWRVADGTLVRSFLGHRDSLYAAVLSPDGTLLATSSYDQQIKLWNAATGEEVRTIAVHNGAVYDLAFRPDGRVLASASADRTVKLWDPATGERLDTLGQSLKELYTLAFSPDGRRLAAAGVDNRIRVWEISEAAREGTNPILHARFAHQAAITRLAWSPDGSTIASAAEDRSVKLWNAEVMQERALLETQPDWAHALAFSADSRTLLAGRLDGSFALYESGSGALVPATPPSAPQLAGAAPRGVQRGVATRVKLTGANLAEITELKFSDPRLVGTLLPAEAGQNPAQEATIEVTPAADLRRGAYTVAVTTAGGTSELRLWVDNLPQIVETEPNDGEGQSPLVALSSGCWGVLDRQGDVDRYSFDVAVGQTIVFDLEAARIGSKANAVLTLMDAAGRTLASSNDFDGEADPVLTYTAPAAGPVTVVVADQALGASGEHFYRLNAGPFPYVTGVYPLSVPGGQETAVELAGYNIPPGVQVAVTAAAGSEAVVPVDFERFRSRRELKVLGGALAELREAEPNDAPAQATPIVVPCTVAGRAHAAVASDADLFRFEARAGERWVIETDAARRGSPIDTRIEVLDAGGKTVERLWLQAVRDSYIEFRGVDSNANDMRLKNWQEMSLNQLLYVNGEVLKLFRAPQGPDSGFAFYTFNGRRQCWFDTSATAHPLEETCYIVEPHPPGTALVPTGLPVFRLPYANDDDGDRKLGRDSRLTFTAPADGAYLVRVVDVRGMGGDRFAYRLTVRRPEPNFRVTLQGAGPTINAGSGKDVTLSVERFDEFDGEVKVEITGLPPGFSISSPVVIEAGHYLAKAVLTAAADAPATTEENASATRVTATGTIDGASVVQEVNNLGRISLAERPKLIVRLEPDLQAAGQTPGEIVVAPGASVPAILKVERNGFEDRINFTVENLPHGVIVDDIGLNGVLIPEGQTERRIFITAAGWVGDSMRQIHAVAAAEGNQSSGPVVFHVRRPLPVAAAGQ